MSRIVEGENITNEKNRLLSDVPRYCCVHSETSEYKQKKTRANHFFCYSIGGGVSSEKSSENKKRVFVFLVFFNANSPRNRLFFTTSNNLKLLYSSFESFACGLDTHSKRTVFFLSSLRQEGHRLRWRHPYRMLFWVLIDFLR